MINEGENMEDLFQLAREENPKLSFEAVQKNFIDTVPVAVVSTFSKRVLTIKKAIIMISIATISTIVLYTLLPVSPSNGINYPKEEKEKQQHKKTIKSIEEEKVVIEEQTIKLIENQINKSDRIENVFTPYSNPYAQDVEIDTNKRITFINSTFPVEDSISEIENWGGLLDKGDELTKIKFVITEKSTEEEILKIKEEAERAGIQMEFKAKRRRGKIKKLTFVMNLIDGKNKRMQSNYYIRTSGLFTTEIKWRENKEGKAVDFDGDECIYSNARK